MKTYCNHAACPGEGSCEFCTAPIIVDRTFADTIKVILPDGYTQKFWVDISDDEAIARCEKMKELGIK